MKVNFNKLIDTPYFKDSVISYVKSLQKSRTINGYDFAFGFPLSGSGLFLKYILETPSVAFPDDIALRSSVIRGPSFHKMIQFIENPEVDHDDFKSIFALICKRANYSKLQEAVDRNEQHIKNSLSSTSSFLNHPIVIETKDESFKMCEEKFKETFDLMYLFLIGFDKVEQIIDNSDLQEYHAFCEKIKPIKEKEILDWREFCSQNNIGQSREVYRIKRL